MKYLKTVLLISSVALFTACGGSSSSSVDYSGIYKLAVTPTTSTDINGNPCLGANGTLTISDNMVSGTALSDWGDTFILNGEVTSSGQISGGFYIGDLLLGLYEGQIDTGVGVGTWADVSQCSGDWVAVQPL